MATETGQCAVRHAVKSVKKQVLTAFQNTWKQQQRVTNITIPYDK